MATFLQTAKTETYLDYWKTTYRTMRFLVLAHRIKPEAGQKQENVCFHCSPDGGVFTLAFLSMVAMEMTM